jgi:hypothetical protein
VLTNYIWGVNKRPFGTGLFACAKRRLLTCFLEASTREGPLWAKYGNKIARDLGLPYETEEDEQRVWVALSDLRSFTHAGEARDEQVHEL